MKNNKVVHVSTVHRWTDNRIFRRECRSLARYEYDVTLIAVADEVRWQDGVRVVPVRTWTHRGVRMIAGVGHALALAWRMNADVYHVHDPELIPILPILRLRRARVIYDAHEDLPAQVLYKHYLPAMTRSAIGAASRILCWLAKKASSHVVAATPTIAKRFSEESTTVLHNYPVLLTGVDATIPYASRERLVVYTGGLGTHRGAKQMIDGMQEAALDGWKLLLVGPHSPANLIQELEVMPGWSRVDYRGSVPPIEARRLTSSARVGLVLFQSSRAHRDAMPNKLFEYMVAGVPIIASDFSLWRTIIQQVGCGILVDPADPTAISEALRYLATNPAEAETMGNRGRQAVLDHLNWDNEERLLRDLYAKLTC